jgi:hypothetical protein
MTPRKITQIVTSAAGTQYSTLRILYALCDDGSVWEHARNSDRQSYWMRLANIPQGDE